MEGVTDEWRHATLGALFCTRLECKLPKTAQVLGLYGLNAKNSIGGWCALKTYQASHLLERRDAGQWSVVSHPDTIKSNCKIQKSKGKSERSNHGIFQRQTNVRPEMDGGR